MLPQQVQKKNINKNKDGKYFRFEPINKFAGMKDEGCFPSPSTF
jgi:hypothetical protein